MKSNKRIIFCIDSLTMGGAERVISVLSDELIHRGYSVDILMLKKQDIMYDIPENVSLYYAEELPAVSLYSKVTRRIFSLYKRIRQGIWKPVLVKLGKYDAAPKIDQTAFYFYANYALPYREYLQKNPGCTAFGFLIRSNIAMLMAAKGLNVKTVFCERNNPVRPDMPANIIKIRDRICRRCSAAVFQTEEERDYYTMLRCPTAVIPNPVKENLPEPEIGERRTEIVNFCRLNAQKNIPLLIEAFARLLQDYPAYTLRIYGRGDEKDNLIRLVQEKNLTESVFFEDFASDVHERIRDAAMYVCSSDFEGLSNSMLEAMAIGMPCVCTDCEGGGARMMIRDHENGILVPMRDAEAMSRGMKEIIENKTLADKMAAEAAGVRDELNTVKIADRWEAMID